MNKRNKSLSEFANKKVFKLVLLVLIVSCSRSFDKEENLIQGESFLRINKLDSAQLLFEKSFKSDSTNIIVLNHLGNIHFRKVEIRKSLYYLNRSLALNNLQVDIHLKIAEIKLLLGKYNEVFMSINKGLLIDDKKPNGYFMKGVAYKHIGDSAKAISSFKTAIEIDYNYYPVYYELGLLLTLKKDSLALSYYKNGVALNPNDPELKGCLAWCYDQFKKYEMADKTYREIVRDFPEFLRAKSNYAFFKNKLGDLDTALILCNEILQQTSTNIQLLNLKGLILQEQGKSEEAKDVWEELKKLESKKEI
jgi:tetratricopeptide (TPR) repeat protein